MSDYYDALETRSADARADAQFEALRDVIAHALSAAPGMAKHLEDLSMKDPERPQLAEEDIRGIAAYLTIVIPKD